MQAKRRRFKSFIEEEALDPVALWTRREISQAGSSKGSSREEQEASGKRASGSLLGKEGYSLEVDKQRC